MTTILISLAVLGGTGVIAAVVLYVVARRFRVEEDPRIADVEALLPGANCGGCGCSGCHDFAVNCCRATSLDGLNCPGAGAEGMQRIARYLGLAAAPARPQVAVLRCNGSCQVRPCTARYDGALSCRLLNTLASGQSGCAWGCLGCGDCVAACSWGAMHMDEATGLPVIDTDKCVGCSQCAKACPRSIIEMRPKGPRGMRVWVACANRDRGALARKVCGAACIGCSKCLKECTHGAITVADNLSYIDPALCKLCKKCVAVCPTGAILTANFPVKKAPAAAPAPAAEPSPTPPAP